MTAGKRNKRRLISDETFQRWFLKEEKRRSFRLKSISMTPSRSLSQLTNGHQSISIVLRNPVI